MFGYIVPDKPNLYMKDYGLYRCAYCGICLSLKARYGLRARMLTNYDSVFLSLLLHNLNDVDYVIKRKPCILHPLRKRAMAMTDGLTQDIAGINVLLSYHKLTDDVIDGGGFKKKAARALLVKKAYKKAKKLHPEAERIISEQYVRLRTYEQAGEKSLDKAADPFAEMMAQLANVLVPDGGETLTRLFYNAGKWIYLTDALDDLEEDNKSGNYNPFIAAHGGFTDLGAFKEELKGRVEFIFNCIYSAMKEDFSALKFHFNTEVLRNILFMGLPQRQKDIMECTGKCAKIRI